MESSEIKNKLEKLHARLQRLTLDSKSTEQKLLPKIKHLLHQHFQLIKQQEKTVKPEESDFQKVAQNALDAIAINDEKGNYLYVNPKASEISGYTPEEMLSLNIRDLSPPSEWKQARERSKSRIYGTAPSRVFESVLLHKSGKKIPIEISASKTEWQGKTADMVFFRDITRRKINEQLIRDKNTELEKINKTKDKLFSIIAHDLKNPFHQLIGLSQLLLEKQKINNPEEQTELIQLIYNSSKEAHALLNNLLIWSRSQQGNITYNPEKIMVNDLINRNLIVQKPFSKAKKINLQSKVEADATIYADREMMNTILRNLISNALKFTHQNGQVTVGCRITGKSNVSIYVTDNGVGINTEKQKHLFSLHKDSSPGTSKESGTGLGLIICKEFAELNGGTIQFESNPGKGSTFYLMIPATP
jgi:PAS domain S-box-containing protein